MPGPALLGTCKKYGYHEAPSSKLDVDRNRRATHVALAIAFSGLLRPTKLDATALEGMDHPAVDKVENLMQEEGNYSTWLVADDSSIRETEPTDGFCTSAHPTQIEALLILLSR